MQSGRCLFWCAHTSFNELNLKCAFGDSGGVFFRCSFECAKYMSWSGKHTWPAARAHRALVWLRVPVYVSSFTFIMHFPNIDIYIDIYRVLYKAWIACKAVVFGSWSELGTGGFHPMWWNPHLDIGLICVLDCSSFRSVSHSVCIVSVVVTI